MTNAQLFYATGVPSLLIVLAWLSNYWQGRRLGERMDRLDARMDRLEALMQVMQNDLKRFYFDLGVHEGRLTALERTKQ